ncbi:MAG: ABC transporter permease [Clostridiales bacterium]|nr:ABC transporter permease [Clostridiales bacterium]
MANNKQNNLKESTELEQTAVSDALAEDSAPIADDATLPTEKDEVAQAVLQEQTAAAAESVALDSDPVAKPAEAKGEEALADRVRIVSPFKLVIKRFFRSRLSVVGLSVFIAVLVFSFLGPLFVPWGGEEVDRSEAQREEFSFIRDTEIIGNDDSSKEGMESGEDDDYIYYLIGYSKPVECNSHAAAGSYGINSKGERALHVLGTDNQGYDIFVRLMYGGRLSLLLSFFVVLVYTVLGVILGGLAGYFGGWVDMVIMRLVDILNCIPSLPILLIVGAILAGNNVDPNLRIYFLMGALTLMSWPGIARLVRGQILFLREQEYMVAADALGFSSARKIFKHLVPNVMPQLIVSMTLGLGSTILTEASLSFLGLGVPMEVASLGQMVSLATKSLTIMEIYIADWLPAGIIIILAVVAFNFIGDGLRDALDPKMKR